MKFITKLDLSYGCDFGSQMAQYASLLSISKKSGHELIFIDKFLNGRFGFPLKDPFIHIPKIVSINDLENDIVTITMNNLKNDINVTNNMLNFKFDSTMNYDIRNDIGLFNHHCEIRDDILKIYTFKEEIREFSKNYIKNIKTCEKDLLISVHFRRGDYLKGFSLNLSINYYNEAINQIISKYSNFNLKFLIFSNDIDWCKNNLDGDCIFVENLNRYQDMCIMSLCDHNIIANSSFSWWGHI